jgi:hypothetical protein
MDLTAAASPPIPRPTPPSNEARDAIEVDRIYLRNNLRLYIREAWHVVEPSTVYLENWHIDLIAEYLEAVTAGQIKRLLINMPPRYAKSTCVSIMWPTWVWAREPFPGKPHNPALEGPGTRWIFASYADELRTKHSLDRRKLLQSDWYRARWPKPAELTSDQNVKTLFSNSSSGVMLATTMLGVDDSNNIETLIIRFVRNVFIWRLYYWPPSVSPRPGVSACAFQIATCTAWSDTGLDKR